MKRITILFLLVFLLPVLSACAGSQGGNALYADIPTAPQSNKSLWVYCIANGNEQMMELALQHYRALYSNVDVKFTMADYSATGGYFDYNAIIEQYTQIAAQVMAGEGPDVFLIEETVMDVEKLVRQGVFADMESFFQAEGFDWEPYNQNVMDGGVWNGKRFVIPLGYNFPLLITTKSALEETGFHLEDCKDSLGFLAETTRYMEDPSQNRLLCYNSSEHTVRDVIAFSGLSIADYDAKTIDLSSLVFERGIQWYKTLREMNADVWSLNMDHLSGAAAVRDGEALWMASPLGAAHGLYYDFGALKTIDEAVMMPIRDMNGGIQAEILNPVAVRANSQNLQNAYNYIKILLSPEVQCAVNGEELHVLDAANAHFYQEISAGRWTILPAGTQGFTSRDRQFWATDPPTLEEFGEFVGFTREITGTHYDSHLSPYKAMSPYVVENADFEETKQEAQQQMEIYISE